MNSPIFFTDPLPNNKKKNKRGDVMRTIGGAA